MIVTDDDDTASTSAIVRSRRRGTLLRRARRLSAYQAGMSDIAAALGLAQLQRIELLLARRKRVEHWLLSNM